MAAMRAPAPAPAIAPEPRLARPLAPVTGPMAAPLLAPEIAQGLVLMSDPPSGAAGAELQPALSPGPGAEAPGKAAEIESAQPETDAIPHAAEPPVGKLIAQVPPSHVAVWSYLVMHNLIVIMPS